MTKKLLVFMLILLFTIFLVFMLYLNVLFPSLYAEEVHNQNVKHIKEVQKDECTLESNLNLYVKVKLDKSSDVVNVCSNFIELDIEMADDLFDGVFDEVKNASSLTELESDILKEAFSPDFSLDLLVEDYADVNVVQRVDFDNYKSNYNYEYIDENTLLVYSYVSSEDNNYYSYLMLNMDEDGINITYFPAVISNLNSIGDVLYSSVLMFILLMIILVIVAVYVFNKNLKNPVDKITNAIKNNTYQNLEIKTNDELELLADTLVEFSSKQQELLQKSNKQNKDQETFLLATAHELKTPIANATMLVNSMIDEVGRYKNVKEHLPVINTELRRVHNIINDLLSTVVVDSEHSVDVNVCDTISNLISVKELNIKEQGIVFNFECEEKSLLTNQKMFVVILDNLITNTINYADVCSEVTVVCSSSRIEISNYCEMINDFDITNLTKPFVKHNMKNSGHGLGLYITNYYANALGYKLDVKKEGTLFKVVLDVGGFDDKNK